MAEMPSEPYGSRELIQRWTADQHRRGLSAAGIRRMSDLYRSFANHHATSLLDATPDDVDAFLDTRRISPSTRSSYLSWLSTFYNWAILHDLTLVNPVNKIQRPRRAALIPRPLGTVDVETVISCADGRMRAWLCLAAWGGMRCKEIATLRREDIFETADPPVIIIAQGKGRKERVIPLNLDLLDALRGYGLPRSGWVFPHTYNPSRHIEPHSVSHKIADFLHGLNVDGHAHQLRHSFGTEVYRRTRDIRLVQELLGHASPVTTAGYTKLVPSAAADVVMGISRRAHPSAQRPPSLPFPP